jgi:DNA primase
MSSSVQLIKEKLGINDVLGAYIKLEKTGANYKAKCPFHNEKTPSFFISPDRGTYYCFGCGAKGDIFSFVMQFEGLDFKSALKSLADKAGVVLEPLSPKELEQSQKEDRIYSCLEYATIFFENQLKENIQAKEYLIKRGLTEETISTWRIGFALKEWRAVHDFLLSHGFTKEEIFKAGLIKTSPDKNNEYYDVFRNRIIFPIFDASSRVIAFSGRILVEEENAPKYLNSPETEVFKKSETLYGINKAKADVRKKDYSILVEGQMDLIMCHQAGFANTLASSGTAFTSQHLEKLKRLSNRIMFCFDGDNAGIAATYKSAVLALSLGLEVKIAMMPTGSDPAEVIKSDPNVFGQALKNSKHIIEFYLNILKEKNSSQDQRKFLKEVVSSVLPLVGMLQSTVEKGHFISHISRQTGIKEEALYDDLKKVKPLQIENKAPEIIKEKIYLSKNQSIERKLIGLILSLETKEDTIEVVEKIRKRILRAMSEEELNTLYDYYKNDDVRKNELLFEIESYYDRHQTLLEREEEIEELMVNLEVERLKNALSQKLKELSEMERLKDKEKIEEIIKECQEITKKLSTLQYKAGIKKI